MIWGWGFRELCHVRDLMATPSDIVLGSLIADSLALGPHWIYSQSEIAEKLGSVDRLHAPMATYHPGKTAGDFTHYGDQSLVLLRSLAEKGGFNFPAYTAAWQTYWGNPATISYRDGATRATLAHLENPANPASHSHDASAIGRIAPLFLVKWTNDEALLTAVRQLTALTHGDPAVVEAAEFFAHVTLAIQRGKSIQAALQETLARNWESIRPAWFDSATGTAPSSMTDAEVLEQFSLACGVSNVFPGVCHLLLRYPLDPAKALMENASAGGDCAARGMILGLVYGASFPASIYPAEWLSGLSAHVEITQLLAKLA